jgi:Ca-activated chloride channel family protein
MTFLSPELLWVLPVLPVVVAAYWLLLRRKKRAVLAYAGLGVGGEARASAGIKRELPAVLYLVALVLMVVALARPSAVVTLPSLGGTVILAIDMSGSMSAKDVAPDRITSAQTAARAFVDGLPTSTGIGVVSFAGTASLVQPPSQDRQDVLAAIDRLQLQRGTAVGSAILVALKAIFPQADFDLGSTNPRPDAKRNGRSGSRTPTSPSEDAPTPVAPGSNTSAAIVLFTDGQTTIGPDPIEAARLAAERGVRVYTVGIGTVQGEALNIEGRSMRVRVDEEALKTIAGITGAEYFLGGTAKDLKRVYQSLTMRLALERRETEITAIFAAAAGVTTLLAGFLSLLWFNRIL